MKRLTVFLLAAFVLQSNISKLAHAAPVTAAEFFKTYAGQYKIDLHGGVKPHDNSIAEIEDLGDAGFMRMGYCPDGSGFCDAGYLDFPLNTTRIESLELSATRALYRIETDWEGAVLKYEWEFEGRLAVFRNLQYPFPSGEVAVLEHRLTRISPSEDSSVAVDTLEFFRARLGNYKIELHAGVEPHANSIGTVLDQSDQALVTLGYCPEGAGFCDIGYRDMPYASTVITLISESAESRLFRIVAKVGDVASEYEWEESGKQVRFKSFNYSLNNEIVPVLEHVLTFVNELLP